MTFKALLAAKTGKTISTRVVETSDQDLIPEDSTIAVDCSTVNYKDAIAITGRADVIRQFPMIPGIDLAGTLEASSYPGIAVGDRMVVNGWGLSQPHHGGYAQKARVKVDSLGSHTLANVLAQTQYRGVVTTCGLAQGMDLPGSALPFTRTASRSSISPRPAWSILRNVTLAGIDSVNAPQEARTEAWSRLARNLNPSKLARSTQVVGLADVPAVVGRMLEGKVRGRTVVDVNT